MTVVGYPLLTEEEFTKEASLLLDPISNPENTILRPNDSVIVMVHNGPEGSSTAVDTSTPYSPTYSGSTYLREFLCRSETVSLDLYCSTVKWFICPSPINLKMVRAHFNIVLVNEYLHFYTFLHFISQPNQTFGANVNQVGALMLLVNVW